MNGPRQLSLIRPVLSRGAVHVFLLRLAAFDAAELTANLCPTEKARAARLKVAKARAQFIITRAALRQLLANYLGSAPRALAFTTGPRGKPAIGPDWRQKRIEFNVSHAADYALLALSLGNRLGVDIESVPRPVDYRALANRFFSAPEQEAFKKLPQAAACAAFYRVWSRKEACLKATGQGLAGGLAGFSVPLEETPVQTRVRGAMDTGSDWFIYNVIAPPGYQTALVADKAGLDIVAARII